MPMYMPPWDTDVEPNEGNIKTWMDNLYGKNEPIDQARWHQGNTDVLFYAGEQRFINSYFNFYPTQNFQSFHFNLIAQPINMVTGYQRQHRKSINFTPIEGAHQQSSDDITKLVTYANNYRGILEKMSQAYEQSAIAGMVMVQPYLDFTDDPVNGTLDLKLWSYNSFMVDPYFREPDMSDANWIWCQQYISKIEAKNYFPEKIDVIQSMSGYGNRAEKFYFLPENYNLARNDLLTLSYIWYKSKRRKKLLYNENDGIAYEYVENEKYLEELINNTGFFQVVEVEVPTWKQAVVLNDTLMSLGGNPLGFDECPMIPVFWNYDPHISEHDLRVRSLTRSMRDSQFLLNRRIIINHDISESSINSGFYRVENSIANPEILKQAGQGHDIIIKDGYQIQEAIQKIIPNAVPPSDMELSNQLADLIFKTSGVNQELLGMADDAKSGIEVLLRQGAGLVTLQKYFDQWDMALKILGKLEMRIIQNKWSPAKISRIIGREPTAEFLNKTFSKYDVIVTEGLNTAVQQQQQFKQMMDLNEALQGIIPRRFILQYATIQGKDEIMKAVDEQEKQASAMQQEVAMLEQAKMQAEIQKIHASATSEIATARERHGRAESNIGLLEERLSAISKNQNLSVKAKVEALEKLLQIISTYGELESQLKMDEINRLDAQEMMKEDYERDQAKKSSDSNKFVQALLDQNQPNNSQTNMMQNNPQQNSMGNMQQEARSALL